MQSTQFLQKLQWQSVCLDAAPDRLALLKLTCAWSLRTVNVRVHRNHAFEFVQSPTQTFLAYGGLQAAWTLSDYDDSLSFNSLTSDGDAEVMDAELVWLDFGHYAIDARALQDWLSGRLAYLRARSNAPILLTGPLPSDAVDARAIMQAAAAVPGVHVLDMCEPAKQLGSRFLDLPRAIFQGTRFSRQAQLLLAQWLGLKWLPAAVSPRLKALAIDLDNTLYKGVLGEDGPAGLELTDGHRLLQESLVRLGEQGILLAVVSKNETADVERMFALRSDFPLRPEHLAGIKANWLPKSDNIAALASGFNIAPSTFALIDDNPGELFAAATAIPGLAILHASDNASTTAGHLALFPGLISFGIDRTDALRGADVRAAAERASASAPQDPAAYLAALETRVFLQARPHDRYKRLCDLPLKTNQFNLALRRLREGEVMRFLEAADHCVVSFDLKDKLSDSGNVGAVYVRADAAVLVVEELCVSCRALGRSIEDVMIGESLSLAASTLGGRYDSIEFVYRHGPRNAPARAWLARLAGAKVENSEETGDEAPLLALRLPFATLRDLCAMRASMPASFVSVIE